MLWAVMRCGRQGGSCRAPLTSAAARPLCAAGALPPAVVCHATVSFLHIAIGVLAPTLAACYCWPQRGSEAPQLRARLRRWAAQADRLLHRASGADGDNHALQALLAWLYGAIVWMCCKAWEGLL